MKLLVLLIALTYVHATIWERNKTLRLRRETESMCILPPYPENGEYTVRGKTGAKPGDQFESAQIQVSCNPGYKPLNNQTTLLCVSGEWSKEMPKCVRYCKLNPHPSVQYRCQVTSTTNESEESHYRSCQSEEPSGMVVQPKCNEPNYYYTGIMSLMYCNEGRWNYIAICQPECGTITPDAKELVFGGRMAKKGEFPWHAAIYRTDFTPFKLICGGSLVSNTVVISAAHCFWNKFENQVQPNSMYAVALGKFYRGWNNPLDAEAQKFNVSDIRVPVRYQGATSNYQDDIALLWLDGQVLYKPHIRPVCLDFDITFQNRQLQDGNLGKVAGWGVKDLEGNPSQVLKVLELPYVRLDRCIEESPASFRPFITSDKICAGYTNGSAVCQGDSGGGLVFSAIDYFAERYYLRGVVSTAPETEEACNAFARTSFTLVTKHKRFIEKYTIQMDTTSDMEEEDILCILPPYPENGSYVMLGTPNAAPGQGYYSVNLIVNCDEGYEPEKDSTISCRYGRWIETIPRCFPRRTDRCKRPTDWGETYKCSDAFNNSQRACNIFESNGTVVTRYCSSEIFLTIFNKTIASTSVASCVNGDWVGDLSCVGDKSCGLVTLPDGSELPWSAAIYRKRNEDIVYICGATIVNNRFIITAAHCMWGSDEISSNYMVAAGKLYPKYDDPRDSHVQTSEVSDIIIPEKYDTSSFENDIALIVLAKRLQLNTFVQPACLDPVFNIRMLKDAVGKTASWRMSNPAGEDLSAKALLRSVAVKITDQQHQCLKDVNLENVISPGDKICAYDIVGQGVCPGDSGLGLVYPVEGRYVLLGVISVGRKDQACSADEPIVFSAVFNQAN